MKVGKSDRQSRRKGDDVYVQMKFSVQIYVNILDKQFFNTLEYHENRYTTAILFSTYQIWEYCSNPTKECSGLLKTDDSIFKLAREELHIVGCRGVPVLTAKHELIYPIGTVWIRPGM